MTSLSGFGAGNEAAPARFLRLDSSGTLEIVTDQLNPPVTGPVVASWPAFMYRIRGKGFDLSAEKGS